MKLSILIIILFLSIAANSQSNWWYWSQLKSLVANNCATFPRNNIIAAAVGDVAPLPPTWTGWKVPGGSCFPYNQNISDSVFRCPPTSMRFELRLTVPECLVGGSIRTEVNRPTTSGPVVNVKRWYGYSIWLQGKDWLPDIAPEACGQWHSNATAPDGTSPNLALWSYNTHWWIARLGIPTIDLGPYVVNAWTDWVFEVQWDNTNPAPPLINTGYLHVWKNGVQVVNQNNIKMGYSTQTFESYMKFGIYKWPWHVGSGWTSNTTVRVCYYSQVRIGNQNATYNDVAPK